MLLPLTRPLATAFVCPLIPPHVARGTLASLPLPALAAVHITASCAIVSAGGLRTFRGPLKSDDRDSPSRPPARPNGRLVYFSYMERPVMHFHISHGRFVGTYTGLQISRLQKWVRLYCWPSSRTTASMAPLLRIRRKRVISRSTSSSSSSAPVLCDGWPLAPQSPNVLK